MSFLLFFLLLMGLGIAIGIVAIFLIGIWFGMYVLLKSIIQYIKNGGQ